MHFYASFHALATLLLALSPFAYSRTAGGHDCAGFLGSASNYAPGDAVRAIQKFQGDNTPYKGKVTRTSALSHDGDSMGGLIAKLDCDSAADYLTDNNGQPYTGQDIYENLLKVYTVGNCGFAGSYYLSSKCYVTMGYCYHCVDTNPK